MASTVALAPPAPADLGPLYQDYAYGYPHKNAYRAFPAPLPLRDLWADERKDRVFLYLHIPFCEMRCGFCNLFTVANPDGGRVERYLAALTRQMEAVRGEIGAVHPVQMAIGGGTPTLLGADALNALFDRTRSLMNADPRHISTGIETSPKTATPETIAALSAWGIDRISIGVQSFIEAETRAMGRPQDPAGPPAALDTIRTHRFGRLNIDLIYGAANQTPDSWRHSLRRALTWHPEELFLYPLYVRPRTGLDGRGHVEDEHRRALYRIGRDLLLAEGYEQMSMRAFRRPGPAAQAGNEFSCQEDGVLGLGTGARSYTAAAHYATRYAVTRRGVLDILDDYAASDAASFLYAHHGITITPEDAMRRFVLKSILRRDGLDTARFATVFGVAPVDAFPALAMLGDMGLLVEQDGRLCPTASGLEHGDAIPPLFYSHRVRALMASAGVA
jgi:oxygen-independent coproporphyrinogen III oxidase